MFYDEASRHVMRTFDNRSHDKESKLDIRDEINGALIAEEGRRPDYYKKKPGEFHVSSLYSCHRGQLMKALCIEAPPKTEEEKLSHVRQLGVFKAGNLFEEFIIDALGDKVTSRQEEYALDYKGIRLVGRSDGYVTDDGKTRVLEVKSVHSNAFWHREKRGELVAWHNQIQLQTYLWLERELRGNALDGSFAYISKDDCTVTSVNVKYNTDIIEQVVKPTLDVLAEAYKKALELGPAPEGATIYDKAIHYGEALAMLEVPLETVFDPTPTKMRPMGQYKVNWIAKYCEHHALCVGNDWEVVAEDSVKKMNKTL